MNAVIVPRISLLEILRMNRDAHKGAFDKADKGYRQMLITQLRQLITSVELGGKPETYIDMPDDAPVDHSEDYDDAIALLEISTGPDVSLTWDDWRKYGRDHWPWSGSFSSSSSSYSSSISSSSSEDD